MTSFSLSVSVASIGRQPVAHRRRLPPRTVAFSVSFHVVVALLLLGVFDPSGAPPPQRSIKAVLISNSLKQGADALQVAASAAAVSTAAPQPISKDVDIARPEKPKSARRVIGPTLATTSSIESAKSASSSSPTSTDRSGVDSDEDSDTLLQRLRSNWLAPPRSPPLFHCRVRITYQAGGFISSIYVLPGCGDRFLDESIERAIWKTQPLPIEDASRDGSIDIDFSP